MKKLLIPSTFLALALAAAPSVSHANEIGTRRTFGLGLVLGYPDVGVSMNIFLNEGMSLQIDPYFAYRSGLRECRNCSGGGIVGSRVDLLFWPNTLATGSVAQLKWFVGPGAQLGLGLGDYGGFWLAAEASVGLGVQFQKAPIDLTLELIPRLGLINSAGVGIGFDVGGALNARYYF